MEKLAFRRAFPCGGSLKDGSLIICVVFTLGHFLVLLELTRKLQMPSSIDQTICVNILGRALLLVVDIICFRGLQRMIPAYIVVWVILNGSVSIHLIWFSIVFGENWKYQLLGSISNCLKMYCIWILYSYYWTLILDTFDENN